MALSETEKLLRRKIVGDAIHSLRDHLGISQTELGRLVDGNSGRRSVTDPGSVSRWERGEVQPQEWKRKELVRIATGKGRKDLADAIAEPMRNWRATLLSTDKNLFNFITLLEICAINLHFLVKAGSSQKDKDNLYEDDFHNVLLDQAAGITVDWLMRRFTAQNPPVLLDDYQRNYWKFLTDDIKYGQGAQCLPVDCSLKDAEKDASNATGLHAKAGDQSGVQERSRRLRGDSTSNASH